MSVLGLCSLLSACLTAFFCAVVGLRFDSMPVLGRSLPCVVDLGRRTRTLPLLEQYGFPSCSRVLLRVRRSTHSL